METSAPPPAAVAPVTITLKSGGTMANGMPLISAAASYAKIGKIDEAKQWAGKIENPEMKKEAEESIKNP